MTAQFPITAITIHDPQQARTVSLAAAVLVGAILFSTGAFSSWAGIVAVGLLMAVVEEDLRRGRIPNRITFLGFAAALLHATWMAGFDGLLSAFAGATVGLAVLAIPFAMGWLGAGDVKAMMALGAFFGVSALPSLLWWITVLGGLLALCTLIAEGQGLELLRRWRQSLELSLLTRSSWYIGPAAGSAAAASLPFGVAIALGVAADRMWGMTWIS
jgi:prepilin peptidase CpaA